MVEHWNSDNGTVLVEQRGGTVMRLFRIRQMRALQNVQQELFKKTKKGEREAKRVLDNSRMPYQQLRSCVIATRDLLFCKMFSPLVCFEQEKMLERTFRRNLLQVRLREKEEADTKSRVWDFNNAYTNTNSRTVKRYEEGRMCKMVK